MRSALLATLCLAAVSRASPFEDALEAQSAAAAALSKAAKYQEAAAALSTWVEGEGKRLEATANAGPWRLRGLSQLAEAYATRARLAKAAAKDPKAARLLLLDLLKPSARVEAALVSDARVAELLETLRKLDPKAKAFFAPRKVRVVITGGLDAPRADELAVAMVEQLRPLGFEASNVEGSETLTLETAMGKELNLANERGGVWDGMTNLISCELIVHAKWVAGGAEVLRVELGSRAPGYSDIPNSCAKAAVKMVATKAGPLVVEAWNAQ